MSWDEGFVVGLAMGRKKFGSAPPVIDDEWTYPPEWLQMPFAAEENTGYFLFSMREETGSMRVSFHLWGSSDTEGGISFDWGDGSTDEINKNNYSGSVSHVFESGKGHKVGNGTVQFLVKVICYIGFDPYGTGAWYLRRVDTGNLKAASYHSSIEDVMYTTNSNGIIDNGGYISYLALSGDVGKLLSKGCIIRSLGSVQKIDVTSSSKITELYSYNFQSCMSLPEKSVQKIIKDVKKIGSSCFQGSSDLGIRKINFPELVEMGNDNFQYSHSLFKFEAPKLKTVGRNCFTNLSSLNYFKASDEFDMETAKANGCFNYSPRY